MSKHKQVQNNRRNTKVNKRVQKGKKEQQNTKFKQTSDMMDSYINSMPVLGSFNQISNIYVNKILVPLVNWLAKILVGRLSENKVKQFMILILRLIILILIIKFVAVYTLPVNFLLTTGSGIVFFLLVLLMLVIWSEQLRIGRMLNKSMDQETGNWVSARKADKEGHPTHISRFERYRVGWIAGSWKWVAHKVSTAKKTRNIIGISIIAQVWIQLANKIDTIFHFNNMISSNIKAGAEVANAHPFLLISISIFLAPVIEEVFFRGIVWRMFSTSINFTDGTFGAKRRNISLILGALFTSVCFAIAHGAVTPGYFLAMFGMGILLSFVYYKSGDMFYNIFVHMGSNILNILIPVLIQVFIH